MIDCTILSVTNSYLVQYLYKFIFLLCYKTTVFYNACEIMLVKITVKLTVKIMLCVSYIVFISLALIVKILYMYTRIAKTRINIFVICNVEVQTVLIIREPKMFF